MDATDEMDDGPLSIASRAIDNLDLPPEVKATLRALQSDISLAYQRNFIAMVQTMQQQASAIARMQGTLQLLVDRMDPKGELRIPTPIKVVEDPADADMSAPLIVADPIGAGFVMTQADLSTALGLSQATVSVLVRAFKLENDGECAIVVRRGRGAKHNTVNYHPRAVDRFMSLVNDPPASLTHEQQVTLRRARRGLGLADLDATNP